MHRRGTYAAQKLKDISGTPTMDILTRWVSLRSNSRWPTIASSSYNWSKGVGE